MKRFWGAVIIAIVATVFMAYQDGVFAENPEAGPPAQGMDQGQAGPSEAAGGGVTIHLDTTSLKNGGVITVTGKAPAGKPVFLEVWAEKRVRASYFDNKKDKTGKIPYILYMTHDMPAYYKLFVPKSEEGTLAEVFKDKKWSLSKALKDLGATDGFTAPAQIKIDKYQASILASILGSRGDILPPMDPQDNKIQAMKLVKERFKQAAKVLGDDVEVNPDGTFRAQIQIRTGLAPGQYHVMAIVDKDTRSEAATFDNQINFPLVYLANAGTSVNALGPFLLTLAVVIFGVLMGAGGGFILNPLLVTIWPFPHTVVAGTVMPTVLFAQGTGIYNYSKIKFINWKLGVSIGLAMLAGGFIGPKLTELITLSQFKFIFGWILLVLAALMFWQTTPGYIEKNKKEQAILKEFKKKAQEAAKGK